MTNPTRTNPADRAESSPDAAHHKFRSVYKMLRSHYKSMPNCRWAQPMIPEFFRVKEDKDGQSEGKCE